METLYEKVGKNRLKELVDKFYDIVFADARIKDLFRTDHSLVRDKQFMFLSQFLGGPTSYTQEYGHPKMKMRHLPHAIDNEAKDAWLSCMRTAIDSMCFEDDLGDALYNCFPKVAEHMVNR